MMIDLSWLWDYKSCVYMRVPLVCVGTVHKVILAYVQMYYDQCIDCSLIPGICRPGSAFIIAQQKYNIN